MNKLLFLFCFFLVSIGLSQTKEEALRDAKITAKATLNSDFKTVLKHTYPPVLKNMGGEKKALETISATMKDVIDQGFKFEKVEVISVSEIVKEQGQYRCYVKNNYVIIFDNQKIKSESYLLGIYNEKERFWYFIEAKQLANPAISYVLQDFETELNIPQGKMITEEIKKKNE